MAISNGYNHHSRGNGKKILAAVIVLIVIAAAVFLLFSGNASTISAPTPFKISTGGTANFKVQDSPSQFSMYVVSTSASGASIYISSTPILANPIVSLSLSPGSAANVSTFGTSHANINLKVISTTNSSVNLQLTPIPTDLSIAPSSSVTIINPSPLPQNALDNSTMSSNQTITPPPPKNTTTTSNKTTTTPPKNTTTNTTNTTPPSQVPALVYKIVNDSNLGSLMNNLGTLYAASAGCNENLYNQAVATYMGQAPVGPFDYYNASLNVPSSISSTVHLLSTNEYIVNYTLITRNSETSGLALTFDISSSGTITGTKFSGLFLGENYTDILNGYTAQSAIHSPCAAYLA